MPPPTERLVDAAGAIERAVAPLPTVAARPFVSDADKCLDWHASVHLRSWATYRPSRWRWAAFQTPNFLAVSLIVCFVAGMVYHAVAPEFSPGPTDIPQKVRDRAALLFAICWLPSIRYLTTPERLRRPIPFFCIYGAFYSLYYAATAMFGRANVLILGTHMQSFDPAHDYDDAVNLLLASWLLLLLGYSLMPRPRMNWVAGLNDRLARVPPEWLSRWALAPPFIGAVSLVLQSRDWWPPGLGGFANLLTLLMEASFAVLVAYWRLGKLSRRALGGLAAASAATGFALLGVGVTAQLAFVVFAMLTGGWLARPVLRARHLVIATIVAAACVAVRGVTTQFREAVWRGEYANASVRERTRFMFDLVGAQLVSKGPSQAVADGWRVLAYRSANVDLLIDVMHRTPDEVPYWQGDTYRSLVGSFVPRLLWPDKPVKALGQEFGHRYHYLADSDHTTSINLPVLVEFYINFSTPGVLLGMFALGMLLRAIEDRLNRPGQTLLISVAATPLLARILVMECDLSLSFGGLPMQLATLWLIAAAMMWLAGVPVRIASLWPPWHTPWRPSHDDPPTRISQSVAYRRGAVLRAAHPAPRPPQ